MSAEDDLGWEYFGPDPMNSPRMMEHMDWHKDPANHNRTGNYGERFLEFHKQFIDKFDQYRLSKGLLPVSGWDPSTPIPAYLSHDHVLTAPRNTDNPFALDPNCATPTWATVQGGTTPDPKHGYTSLLQFQSEDELGWSIDSGWHGTVHNTIGGDMSQFHSPIDPVFWRWHRWIDNVRAAWVGARNWRFRIQVAEAVRILVGVTNDGPGVVIGPDGIPIPVPGGPGPVLRGTASESAHLLVGIAMTQLAQLIEDPKDRARATKLATDLVAKEAQNFTARVAALSK
jgi:hypothetical protein